MDTWGMMLMCKTFLLAAGVAVHEGGGLLVVAAIHLEVGHLHTVGKIHPMLIGTSNCTFFFFFFASTKRIGTLSLLVFILWHPSLFF